MANAISTDPTETALLECLDALLHAENVRRSLEKIGERVERRLVHDLPARMAWEPVALELYGVELPASIRSSWVFVLRANTESGAERHPNSRQRMMSYRGSGDLQTRKSLQEDWSHNALVSTSGAPLRQRWISVPPNVWHQAVVPQSNWVVVSFHTASADELIEERPDAENAAITVQRRYAEMLFQTMSDDATVSRAYLDEAGRQLAKATATIQHCLNQLNEEQVWWRPTPSQNSIANLLLHLCGNVRQWIISGVGGKVDIRRRPDEFSEQGPISKAELLHRLDDVVQQAAAVLNNASPETLLTQRRIQGFDATGLSAIFDSVAHFKGHTQEIICLTRMQLQDAYKFNWAPSTPEEGAA